MSDTRLFERCRAYVTSSVDHATPHNTPGPLPAITLSRQVGARGTSVGRCLVNRLSQEAPPDTPPWTLFDKGLIRRVLEDHELPQYLERFMGEERISELQATINEIVGLHPSLWELHEKIVRTVLRLLAHGHVIIVGRGGCVIGASLRHVLHVRLIGSPQRRMRHIEQAFGLNASQAAQRMRLDDHARRDYFKSHFGRNIDDPLLYHLIINTDLMSDEEIANVIAESALRRVDYPPLVAAI